MTKTLFFRTGIVLLAGAALFALLFHRFWFQTVVFRDAFLFFAPAKFQVAKALRQGEVWSWQPWIFLGMPFVADIQAGWFYPLNLLFLVLPFEPAYRLLILVHYPLAGLFMGLFLRGRGLSLAAASLGSAAFGLCGHLVSQHASLTMLIGATWAPWCFFCLDRALARGQFWAAWAGAGLAMQVLAGDPQAAWITALLLAGLTISRSARASRGERFHALMVLVMAGAASLVLCLVQLLPTYELLVHSVRKAGVSDAEMMYFSFHPLRLVEFFWPTPFGSVADDQFYWADFARDFQKSPTPWCVTNYLGLPVLALAALGLLRSGRRMRLFLAGGLVVFLLLGFGSHTPLFGWLHSLPGFNLFRYPEKYLAWFSGLAAAAGALGLEVIEDGLHGRPTRVRGLALFFLGLTVALVAISAWAWPAALAHGLDSALNPERYAGIISVLRAGGAHLFGFSMAGGLILLAAGRFAPVRDLAPWLLVVMVALDLGIANVPTMPAGPAEIYHYEAPLARTIKDYAGPSLGSYRVFREDLPFLDVDPRLSGFPPGLRRVIWERATLKPNTHVFENLETLNGYSATLLREGSAILLSDQLMKSWQMEMFNVRFAVSTADRRLEVPGLIKLVARDPVQNTAVWELLRVRPRAYYSSAALTAADEEEALRLLESAAAANSIVVTTTESTPAPAAGEGWHPVVVRSYEPDLVVVECEAKVPGWVVLSDRFFPGWKAWVNGSTVPIYQANVMVRAVRVPAGKSEIVFRFEPWTLRWGATVSGRGWVGLVFWLTAALVGGKRRGYGRS
jgi:hypothetical protein